MEYKAHFVPLIRPRKVQYHLNDFITCSIENTRGTTCGKAGPSAAAIVCHTWSGGQSMATKIAIDGPGRPVVAGDHLQHDRPCVFIVRDHTNSSI